MAIIRGLSKVLSNLRQVKEDIVNRVMSQAGAKAARIVLAKAKELTPERTGRLVNSYTTIVRNTSSGVYVMVGNNCPYSLYVHEMPSTTRWRKDGAENKFLEKALIRTQDQVAAAGVQFVRAYLTKKGGAGYPTPQGVEVRGGGE